MNDISNAGMNKHNHQGFKPANITPAMPMFALIPKEFIPEVCEFNLVSGNRIWSPILCKEAAGEITVHHCGDFTRSYAEHRAVIHCLKQTGRLQNLTMEESDWHLRHVDFLIVQASACLTIST